MKKIAIVGYKCKQCGRVHYPFHDRCLQCRGRDFEEIKPEGRARLVTFTRIYNLPWGFDQRYLTIGVVEFENCLKAMGQIDMTEDEDVQPGMMLEAAWKPVRYVYGEPVYGLVFSPA
jgi:uncharacterized protein